MISKKEIVGKWLWLRNSRIHVLSPACEKDFFIVEEPEKFPEPRPVHYDGLKKGKVIDPDWRPPQITIETGKCTSGFCSCSFWRVGKPYAELVIEADAEDGQLERCLKELQDFFKEHAPNIIANGACSIAYKGKVTIRFIAMEEDKDKPESSQNET